jgi:hypothetical protein
MILAWLALAPTGLVFAQFYRRTWPSLRPFGSDLWFASHRVIALLRFDADFQISDTPRF